MDVRTDVALDPLNHTSVAPQQGRGGEMVLETETNRRDKPWLIDTVKDRPDMLAADASVARLDLAAAANTLTMAVDVAETIQAANSLERMLAHQMATAHHLAMTLAAKLEFGHSRGVAERVDDAVAESGSEFCRLRCVPGGQKTLFAPDLLPDCGKRVSEGGPLLAVPSGR
jgi:hypothetical protein